MIKNIIFDLDGTLTDSRSEITQRMTDALADWCLAGKQIAITSGAELSQMVKQIPYIDSDKWPFHILPQSGNMYKHGEVIWEDILCDAEREEMYKHIGLIKKEYKPITENLLEDRGCQIAYSLIGHDAPKDKKKAFDPTGQRRLKLLEEYPLQSDIVDVRVAGGTCLDYTARGKHKGYNVQRLIDRLGWNKDECVYIGDALFKGGNDETVIGVIDTLETSGWQETIELMKSLV